MQQSACSRDFSIVERWTSMIAIDIKTFFAIQNSAALGQRVTSAEIADAVVTQKQFARTIASALPSNFIVQLHLKK